MGEISSGLVILMGMGVVFFGLICIVLLIALTGAIFKLIEKKPAKESLPEVRQPAAQPAVGADRGELVAAVAAVLAEELGTDVKGLRIVEFKQICS